MNDESDQSEKLLTAALKLPRSARARLAAELIASIDGEPDVDVVAAWAAEIDRRVKRVQDEGAIGDGWQKVHQRIADRLSSK